VRALELMEMQRHAQLMYTSCGWFFDDISGIETVQVIAYAARVLQLAQQLFGEQAAPLEPAFLARLAEARSNDPEAGDGASIYKKCVETMELHLEQVAAHYAISSIFSSFADETELFCYPRPPHLLRDLHLGPRPPRAGPRACRQRHHRHAQSFSFCRSPLRRPEHYRRRQGLATADAAAFEAFSAQPPGTCSAPTFPR
jgi:hypothetical protein